MAKLGLNSFDAWVWILVIFPLFTGGVWFQKPGLWLELSEITIPVLLGGVLAVILRLGLKVPIESASSIRLIKYLWNFWTKALETSPKKTLGIGFLSMGSLWFLAAYQRHATFHSHGADLGIFTSAIWNLTHGNGYISSLKDGINLFGDHQSPLFWLAYPAFKLFPNPVVLLFLQSFILAAGAIVFYFLGLRALSPKGLRQFAAVLPLLYWCYSPIRSANRFDFHPETWFLPVALAAVWGLQSSKNAQRWMGLLFFLLALGAKESSPIVLAGLSFAWILGFGEEASRAFTRRLGAFLLPVCLGVGYFDIAVAPKLLNLHYSYQDFYTYLGDSGWRVVLSPLLNPMAFWGKVLSWASIKFFLWILGPLLLIPLLDWRGWVLLFPTFLMYVLSKGDLRIQPIYHYGIEPAFAAFVIFPGALVIGLNGLKKHLEEKKIFRNLLWAWCFVILLGFGRSELFFARKFEHSPHTAWLNARLLPCVSSGVPLSASGALVPHLVQRKWVHHLPHLETPAQWVGQEQVSCVVFDSEVNNWPLKSEEWPQFLRDLTGKGYSLEYSCQGTQIYHWKGTQGSQGSCLSCLPPCP